MIIVKVEKIREIEWDRKEINQWKVNEIDFYEDGELLEIDQKIVEDFMLTGLNTMDFINSNYYKKTDDK